MLLSHGSRDAVRLAHTPEIGPVAAGIAVLFQWFRENFVMRGTSCDAR
jgi:hypothetical protein